MGRERDRQRERVCGCKGFREGNGECGKYCQQILLALP